MLAAAFVAWERRTEQPMLDLSLFRNPRFTAASASVAISFFALFGFIFLVTQYFQFVKGYGPLSTGVRLLPVATLRRDRVDRRHQARGAGRHEARRRRPGSFLMAAFYLWVTTASTQRRGYGTIAAQMVVLGTGMGLTSAPATEAIMGVVPKAKAGVGSAVNDATRLLGGTLGVAVIGSVYASLYASRLTSALPAGFPSTARRRRTNPWVPRSESRNGLDHAGHPSLASAVHDAASSAFFQGFHAANYVAAGVAAVGALMALRLLPAHPLSRGATSRALVPEQDHVGAEEALPVPSTTG